MKRFVLLTLLHLLLSKQREEKRDGNEEEFVIESGENLIGIVKYLLTNMPTIHASHCIAIIMMKMIIMGERWKRQVSRGRRREDQGSENKWRMKKEP